MKKVIITENSTLNLEEKYIPIINDIISNNSDLPIKLNNNILSFNDYTVGIIKFEDMIIEIQSRNDAISMNSIFEMYSFINSSKIDSTFQNTGYDLENSFELTSITHYFYKICYSLLSHGLTGTFKKEKEYSNIVKGSIVFEDYIRQEVPFKGISVINEEYTVNSIQNQIIKAAIRKLKETEQSDNLVLKLNLLLREFDFVADREFNNYELEFLESNLKTFYSSNNLYPIVLETSIKILKDLKTSYNNGSIEWYSFLVNSNDTFEKYVRKLLKIGLVEDVVKWKEPKIFSSIKGNNQNGFKSYSPDVLIDYHETYNVSRAVIDVKNKLFNPIRKNVAELVSSNDLYQMIFYCRKLKSNVGGIIYPTNEDYLPFKIEISDEGDPLVFLISINMKDSFENRYNKLIKEVKNFILINT
jgi:5-methylcytosine-specific restriction enzyme subunit McrC